MKPIHLRSRTARRVALFALIAGPVLVAAARPAHLELEKSSPADGATVSSISEIRLTFTDTPMNMGAKTVSIRILGADGRTLSTGSAVKDPNNARVYSLALPRGLEPQAYRVAWETMANDGDVVKGEFRFTVAATN